MSKKTFETALKVIRKSREPSLNVRITTCRNPATKASKMYIAFNPQAPVSQKIADEAVFRRFQGE